ncbi:hypothetical protein I4U23_022528 [Adineta vaga]|nr:hypothetical protein I4U23_022528 [Adineta vaga]
MILLILILTISLNNHFNSGEYSLNDQQCLDFYANEQFFANFFKTPKHLGHQIIPFCLSVNNDNDPFMIEEDIPSFTFDQLIERNISTYQENRSELISRFYHCATKDRFGLFCEYSLLNSNSLQTPFAEIVVKTLKESSTIPLNGTYTAYSNWQFQQNDFSFCSSGMSCYLERKNQFHISLLKRTANTHINADCWVTMICLVHSINTAIPFDLIYQDLFNGTCDNICFEPDHSCTPRLRQYCPTLFEFPASSIGWNQLYFIYSWNRTGIGLYRPNYICFNEHSCANTLLDCREGFDEKFTNGCVLNDKHQDEAQCSQDVCNGIIGHPCLLPDTLEFICLPINRSNDGIIDCLGATDEPYLCKNFPFSIGSALSSIKEDSLEITSVKQIPSNQSHCHSGIPIHFRNHLNCLCPPSLYGSQCQYQNQRISIILQIGAPEWRTPFVFVIYLLDNRDGTINSYHSIRYVSTRDCSAKFRFNLIYLTKPKLSDRTYSIRIDLFEMETLKYRTSWFFLIQFSFLPVCRLSTQLVVPLFTSSIETHCPITCSSIHGECLKFINTNQYFFRILTPCASNSLCIPRDYRITVDRPSVCLCATGYYGDQCHLNETRIDLLILTSDVPQLLLLHFIYVGDRMVQKPFGDDLSRGPHERATVFKKIPPNRNLITFYWSNSFHILFGEFNKNIYLILTQLEHITSKRIKGTLRSHRRCLSIHELLNKTILNLPRLRRVKYYHKPCREQIDLSCFYDEVDFMCLCTFDRRANCFQYENQMIYNCRQLSICENGGQCFQDHPTCPTAALCSCQKCFLDTRCQISTRSFDLTLDIILGYQIQSDLSFLNQLKSVQISFAITIVMFIIGFINGILCLIVFRRKKLRDISSGLYLYIASIISLLTITIFALKLLLVMIIQFNFIRNRIFLKFQCWIIDFILKGSLQIILIKNEVFKLQKKIILCLSIFVLLSSIHEPIHRILIEDEEDKRFWCTIESSQFLHIFSSIITIFHVISPFIMNILSTIGFIILESRRRSQNQQILSSNHTLRDHFNQFKYLILSPIGLILLALPRIIFIFTLECLKSSHDSITLFLIGYFVSFLSPVISFIIFVLPLKGSRTENKIDEVFDAVHSVIFFIEVDANVVVVDFTFEDVKISVDEVINVRSVE